jgi:hypothetical protein
MCRIVDLIFTMHYTCQTTLLYMKYVILFSQIVAQNSGNLQLKYKYQSQGHHINNSAFQTCVFSFVQNRIKSYS